MIRRPLYRSPLLILLVLFLLQWLLLQSIREPTWDAVSYYVYARSAVFDGDLNFENDYQLSYPTAGEHFASKELDQITTGTGQVSNLFAVGTALLWLPWLSVLRLVAPFLLAEGTALTGYERFFVSNLATLSAIFGFLAILIAYRVAEALTNRRLGLASAVTLMFVTPMIFYQFREPMYSHTASALAVSLCVYIWWRQHKTVGTGWQGLAVGAAIGLAALVRWQNLTYFLLPLISAFLLWFKNTHKWERKAWAPAVLYLAAAGVATLAVFFLQMAVWRLLYGSFITIPQGNSFIGWRPLYLIPFLFSSFRGVLPWMPVFFLSLIGLFVLSKRNPQAGVPLLIMLMLAVYINGSTRDWFAGAGFGPRRLTSELVILVIGYAAFLSILPQRFRAWGAVLIGIILALHQWILLRFGLLVGLGGKVMSMSPTFDWKDVPLSQFASDMSALMQQALETPSDFLIFPDSPLGIFLRQQIWPIQHMATLLATSLFVLFIGTILYIWRSHTNNKKRPMWALLAAMIILGLLNFWILTGA